MERVGEYLIKRLIGEGGMGKVFEAEERLSKRRVALKVLHPDLAGSEAGRAQFIGEMGILSKLDHPNIVRCLACSEHDGKLVMALEYLEGQTLRELLVARGALPWHDAVAIATKVARGLDAAHRPNVDGDPPIIHRDLKPENIMILSDGNVKVMDFGIAKVVAQMMTRHTTRTVGTLQYMSPEQIDATGLDARSDYYSLGLVLYEMLTGAPPFNSESPRELLNKQCTEPPPPLPDDVRRGLPRGIETLLFRLLEKSPDNRPSSTAELLAALEPFAPADGAGPSADVRRTSSGAATPRIDTAPRVSTVPGVDAAPTTPASISEPINTVQLIERARAEKTEVPTILGIVVILVMSALAGLITYVVRATG
ncbi:MAG: serine/threonine protein kinase [Myxococcales bacterium]|nr:serine/threonine protein kinase [Myxococcales bacterium]